MLPILERGLNITVVSFVRNHLLWIHANGKEYEDTDDNDEVSEIYTFTYSHTSWSPSSCFYSFLLLLQFCVIIKHPA